MAIQNPAAEIDSRYHIEAKLGQGASGVVYRVFDNKLKRRSAIKLLKTDSTLKDSTQRFEREFHAISRLKHPNIIAVHELAKNYFTMEYVEGTPLNPQDRRDIHTIILIAIEICRALRYIHSQGIIHGDLKPAHILLTPSGEVRLIDFGLSREFNPAAPFEDPRVTASGTLEYMAPELAKGIGIDPRADLYSLGVLLYELCTGRPPFSDRDPMALIMKQIEAAPTPPRTYNAQIPRDLEKLILKLLAKDASARCQSADEVLSILTQQIGRREIQESRVERGSRHLLLPRFVGRAREMAALESLFQKTVRGEGAVALVHGERGAGCSRLAGEFGASHFFGGSIAVHAICDPTPARPYAPFAAVAELGWALLEKRARSEGATRQAMAHAGGLKRLSSALAKKESLKAVRAPLFADARRLAEDLGGLLSVLAQIEPVLVILEDVHWMDRLSCQLLERLARVIAPNRVFLCLTAKDPLKGEVTPFHELMPHLMKLPHWHDLPLLPLASPEIVLIAASMLGRASLDDPLPAKIVAAARGNPLVAQETMKALAEQGILYKKGGAWHVDAGSIERVKPSEELENWLFEKAHHLDEAHATVLAAACLIGRRITFDLLHAVTETDRTTLYTIASNLVHERILSETEINRERVYAVASDRLRKAVYKDLDDGVRRKWHGRAAELLRDEEKAGEDPPIEEIAHHFQNSRTPEEALPYLLRCAERAAGLLAFQQAIDWFATALAIGDQARRHRDAPGILVRMGELWLEQDNRVEARRHLVEALERCRRDPAETRLLAARAQMRLAEASLRDRMPEDAARHVERARALYQQTGDAEGLVQAILQESRILQAKDDLTPALDAASRAEAEAERLESPLLAAEAALLKGQVLDTLGRSSEAAEPLAKAERLYASLEQAEGGFQARVGQVRAFASLGQVEEAQAAVDRVRADIDNMRPPLRARGYLALAQLESRAWQLGAADQMFDRAMRVAEESDDPGLAAEVQREKARAYLAQAQMVSGGRRRDALRLFKQSSETFARAGMAASRLQVEAEQKEAERAFLEGDAEGLKRERDDLRFLQQLSATVNSELDLERLLNLIMDMVVEVVRAERGFLILAEDRPDAAVGETPLLRIAVARNIDQEIVDRPEFKISNTIAQRVIERKEPILTRDAQTDERFRSKISVLNLKLRSILCVPLLSKQKVIGAVYVDNRFVSERFNEDNLRLLVAFADQAAIAIENARLYRDNLQRRIALEEANRSIRVLNEQLEAKMHAQGKELAQVKEVLASSQRELAQSGYHAMIGKSDAIRKVFRQLERLKDTEVTVLLQGESGTGKELVAHQIHVASPRKDKRFVSENCAAIAPSLLESELFGHVKGAFTGAAKDKKGLFETAHKGTLFLDEIGEMSLEMQAKLLRVLENGELRPVGGTAPVTVDVRIIAATNRDLEKRVAEGKFRQDLFYRLDVVRIDLPPLRQRKDDIPLLLEHFLKEGAAKSGLPVRRIAPGALRVLMDHPWPGNVRELKSVAERLMLLAASETVEAADAASVLGAAPAGPAASARAWSASYKEARRQVLDDFNRDYLTQALDRQGGNVSAAAREIGIERQYLHKIIKALGLAGHAPAGADAAESPDDDLEEKAGA